MSHRPRGDFGDRVESTATGTRFDREWKFAALITAGAVLYF